MEDGREGRQRVCARHLHLAHHVDLDGARLADGQLDFGIRVAGAQLLARTAVGLLDGEAAQLERAEVFDDDAAVGRDCALDG